MVVVVDETVELAETRHGHRHTPCLTCHRVVEVDKVYSLPKNKKGKIQLWPIYPLSHHFIKVPS